jgi:hypothetical protein
MEGEASENFGFQILNTTNLQKQHKDILWYNKNQKGKNHFDKYLNGNLLKPKIKHNITVRKSPCTV